MAIRLAGRRFCHPPCAIRLPEFKSAFTELASSQLLPAFRKYREFLEREYLPAAREDIGISAHPEGLACYDASVRQFSSLPMPAKEVHELGLRQMDTLMAEMRTVAGRAFQTADVPAVLEKLRTDRRYMFKSRQRAGQLLGGGAGPRQGGGTAMVRAAAEG